MTVVAVTYSYRRFPSKWVYAPYVYDVELRKEAVWVSNSDVSRALD